MVFAFDGDMNDTPFGNIASTACKSWVLDLVCPLPHIVVAGEDQEEYFERHERFYPIPGRRLSPQSASNTRCTSLVAKVGAQNLIESVNPPYRRDHE